MDDSRDKINDGIPSRAQQGVKTSASSAASGRTPSPLAGPVGGNAPETITSSPNPGGQGQNHADLTRDPMLIPSHKTALQPLSLDIERIREPKEHRFRRYCTGLLILSVLMSFGFPTQALLLWIALGLVTSGILEQRFRGTAVKVGEEQFTRVHAAAERAARLLDVKTPIDVYVTCRPGNLDIYTLKLSGRFAIVIHSNWVAMLDDDEMEFVLAHELAHIRAGHMPRLSLINVIRTAPPIVRLLAAPLEAYRYIYSPWTRKTVVTADRLALEAIDLDIEVAVSALAKIAAGEELYAQVNPGAFVRQAEELRYDIYLLLNELVNGGPLPVRRVSLLERYLAHRPKGGYPAPPPGLLRRLLRFLTGR